MDRATRLLAISIFFVTGCADRDPNAADYLNDFDAYWTGLIAEYSDYAKDQPVYVGFVEELTLAKQTHDSGDFETSLKALDRARAIPFHEAPNTDVFALRAVVLHRREGAGAAAIQAWRVADHIHAIETGVVSCQPFLERLELAAAARPAAKAAAELDPLALTEPYDVGAPKALFDALNAACSPLWGWTNTSNDHDHRLRNILDQLRDRLGFGAWTESEPLMGQNDDTPTEPISRRRR
ncbi:MAG: hypothetical protein ACFB2Z_09715 [Maricaulaceae bacterium]